MIYLDNAASGGFKPQAVIETAVDVIKYLSVNPGRSSHRLSRTAGDYVFSARKKLAEFFGASTPARVCFTKNCTEALNVAIHGGIKKGRVLTSVLEHNSVLRPLFALEKKGDIELEIIKPSNGYNIRLVDVKKAYSPNVSAVVLTSASNVTGAVNEIAEIGDYLKNKNCVFIVDGAQGAGHMQLSVKKHRIDMLAVAGHKGLYSIQGVGALILSDTVNPEPIMQGGTGTESFNPNQPDCYPERLESGTLNLPAICTLEEGISYIEKNLDFIKNQMEEATEYLINKLAEIDGVKIYSKKNPVGIVSFSLRGTSSTELSETLSNNYDIAVRGGYHCAPLCHKFLKTEDDGLIRASLSPHNQKRELNALITAVKEISNSF